MIDSRAQAARPTVRPLALLGAAIAIMLVTASGTAGREPAERAHAASYLSVEVPIAEAPWVAALIPLDRDFRPAPQPPEYAFRCSGVVIGPRRVLTANHCVDRQDMSHHGIRVGAANLLDGTGRVVPIARTWTPFVGSRNLTDIVRRDLAVIETKEPLGVPAILFAAERPRPGEAVSSFGFGNELRHADGHSVRPVLRRLDSVVALGCRRTEDREAICAVAGSGGSLGHGDSGGPMVVLRDGAPALAGITVAAEYGQPDVSIYGNVLTQRAFIDSPPQSALAPAIVRPIHISGRVRPGRRVSCDVSFVPRPRRVLYEWRIGGQPRPKTLLDLVYDENGRRIANLTGPEHLHSTTQSITLPRDAGGKRLQCTVTAASGPGFHRVAIAVVPKLPNDPRR